MIAIKSMRKIPQSCAKCRFYEVGWQTIGYGAPIDSGPTCWALNKKHIRDTVVTRERMKECPLVEIETEADNDD